jgi:ech hydrogenase subunit D
MLNHVTEITLPQLHPEVWSLKNRGHRFVTITCTDLGEAHDVLYHFDKDYELCHLRLRLPRGEALPSISPLFFAAVVVENEMQDLFGITVSGMAVDYKGRFILSEGAPLAPLNKPVGIGIDIRTKAPAPAAEGEKAS